MSLTARRAEGAPFDVSLFLTSRTLVSRTILRAGPSSKSAARDATVAGNESVFIGRYFAVVIEQSSLILTFFPICDSFLNFDVKQTMSSVVGAFVSRKLGGPLVCW